MVKFLLLNKRKLLPSKSLTLILVVCLLAPLLLIYRITEVPPGINGDESGIGYNALLVSRNLTDENGNRLPLFIFAKGSDWKQPVSVYTTALMFKVFGASFWVLRATSILFVISSLIILYFISKEHKNTSFFLFSSLILVTSPIIVIQSHLALENIALLPFIFLWILMMLKLEKGQNHLHALLGGVSLGVGLFSYYGMRLIVPVLVFMSLLYLRRVRKLLIHFLVGVMPFFLLLLIAHFRYPSAVIGSFSAPFPSLYDFLYRYLSSFDLSFLFFKGDITQYHSTGKYGMLLIPTLPLFFLGLHKIMREKRRFEMLILVSFFLTPILFGFIPDVHRASRLLALVPLYTIISTLGLLSTRKLVMSTALVFICIAAIFFLQDYWFAYPERVRGVFPIPIEKTYEFRIKK